MFLFLIVDYVFLTVGWHGSVALIVSAIWLGLTVLLAFRTSEVPHRLMLVIRVAVAIVVAAAIGVAIGGGNREYGVIVILGSLLVLASPIAIGWRLLHHTRVTTQTVLGALCIYVLIGLVFANADYGVQLSTGNSFFAQPGQHGPADFAYFSYITMATVGYGDLSPAFGFSRTLAVLEALMGQIFLVVLVARLVGMYTPTFRWGHELHGGAAVRGRVRRRVAVTAERCAAGRPARSPVASWGWGLTPPRGRRGQTMRTTGTIIGRRFVRSPTNLPNALRVWRLSTSMSWAPSRRAFVTAAATTSLASPSSSSASGA